MDLLFSLSKKIKLEEQKENSELDNLLAKFIAGESTISENEKVKFWLEEKNENKVYLAYLEKIWANGKDFNPIQVDTDAAWNKLQNRIKNNDEIRGIKPEDHYNFIWIKIAASVLLFFGLSFTGLKIYQNNFKQITESTIGERRQILLPDGSTAYLNKNSQISFRVKMNGKERLVKLSGEVFFSVKPDREHPFIVEANGLDVKVLGTKFNVKAFSELNTAEIIVESGNVAVRNSNDSVHLTRGEKVVVNKKLKKLEKSLNANLNYLSYQTNTYVFKNENLENVINDLELNFGKKISLSDEILKKCMITATFKNNTFKEIISVLAETLNLKISEKGELMILEGKGC